MLMPEWVKHATPVLYYLPRYKTTMCLRAAWKAKNESDIIFVVLDIGISLCNSASCSLLRKILVDLLNDLPQFMASIYVDRRALLHIEIDRTTKEGTKTLADALTD